MLGVEVFRPLRDLRVLLHQGMLGLSAARGVLALLATTSPVRDEGGAATDVRRLAPTVAFEDVTFRYPGGRGPPTRGCPSACKRASAWRIVGPSGSGKSTVARLLLRFHDPQSGRVLVGGRDVRDLRLADLRALMAVVHQDTYLFHGTVAENLRMGRPDATAAELEAAAREAHAHEFIARLPQGYETVVGERGVRLSGGQRQRIAIARALLRDAPILILDEALSSVDAESEALIQAALDRLMAGRTTLIFAHRLSSVIGADRILVLDGGRVVESGTHAELLGRGGAYRAAHGGPDRGAGRSRRRPRAAPDRRRRRGAGRGGLGDGAGGGHPDRVGAARVGPGPVGAAGAEPRLPRPARDHVPARRGPRRRADRRGRGERPHRAGRPAGPSRSAAGSPRSSSSRRSPGSSTGSSRGWPTTSPTGSSPTCASGSSGRSTPSRPRT